MRMIIPYMQAQVGPFADSPSLLSCYSLYACLLA